MVAAGPSLTLSSKRTCQNAVLPEKKATLPPPAMNASTVSRIEPDQYSSWPTDNMSRYADPPWLESRPGWSSRSALVATSTAYPSASAHSMKGSSQSGQPADPAYPERWLSWMYPTCVAICGSGGLVVVTRRPAPGGLYR